MRNICSSIIIVLVLSVVTDHVHSTCDFTSDHANLIYLSVMNDSLPAPGYHLTQPPSHLHDFNQNCPDDILFVPCCASSTGSEEYLFLSLDDVFFLIEAEIISDLGSDFLIALISGGKFPLQSSHEITHVSSIILQSFDNSTIKCADSVRIQLKSICSVTLHGISFSNCGNQFEEGIELKEVDTVSISKVTVGDSPSTGLKLESKELSGECGTAIPSSINYSVSDSVFINNGLTRNHDTLFPISNIYGGAIYIKLEFLTSIISQVTLTNLKFFDNIATYGAGLNIFATDDAFIKISRCEFHRNRAFVQGGSVYFEGSVHSYGLVDISNSTFIENNADLKNLYSNNPCSLYLRFASVNISNSIFFNHSVSVINLRLADVQLIGNVEFTQNRGLGGGGALNVEFGLIKISSNASVLFSCNRAIEGGAIYSNRLSLLSSRCLFDFPEDGQFNVTFALNSAIINGDSIYYEQPNDQCRNDVNQLNIPVTEVGSGVVDTTFYTMDNDTACTDMCRIQMMLGQHITFRLVVTNFFDQPSFLQVNLKLKKISNKRDLFCSTESDYPHKLNGPTRINLESGINRLNLSIVGPEILDIKQGENHTLSIIDTSDQIINEFVITITPCKLGFVYNDTLKRCECIESKYLLCNVESAVSCISVGYWIGHVDELSNNSIARCASLYCRNTANTFCTDCSLSDEVNYCQLPVTSEDQCLYNRDGVLCSQCRTGYAFTFGGIKCVPDSTCNKGMGLIPAALNIVFLIFTVAILIVMLKFGYRFSTGYLYCFIFYFSVVRHFVSETIVGNGVLLYISIPASFTQLNPQFLGYMPICFAKTFTNLQQQMFLYLNPMIISIFVLLVIGVSKRFSKIRFADNTMVKAICLLMLLSFTALSETSFNIMNPVRFTNTDDILVNLQPSTKYCDITQHLPYLVVAVLVFLVLVIPFTLLLLFAPLLTKCFNMNKIKPFLDEFQGCYKDRFRWMAGYYFLARFVYLVNLSHLRFAPSTQQYVVQLLTVFILVIHLLLQPYSNTWLNVADSVLLVDLLLLTMMFGDTANLAFQDALDGTRVGIVTVLVTVPILYLILVVIVTVGGKYWNRRSQISGRFRNSLKYRHRRSRGTEDDIITYNKKLSSSTSTELRESLLDDIEDDEEMYVSIPKDPSKPSRLRKLTGGLRKANRVSSSAVITSLNAAVSHDIGQTSVSVHPFTINEDNCNSSRVSGGSVSSKVSTHSVSFKL